MLPVCGSRPVRKVTPMGFPWIDDIVEAVVDVVEDVVDEAVDAVVDAGSAVAGAAVEVGSTAVGFAGDALDATVNLADDTVFDGVDYLTGGTIDFDYDDGTFGANIGIDGVAEVGIQISEDGVEATIDATVISADLGITDQGFSLSGSGGVDFGPLPYAEGHVSVSADGDVIVNGHAQGTIPLPGGILSGNATAGFETSDEGWAVSLQADGTYTMPSGTAIGGGVVAGYAETADGDSHTTLGVSGSVSSPGMGSVGGGIRYEQIEKDGVSIETVHAEGYAEGFGVRVDAEADYVGIETPTGSASAWTSDLSIDAPDALEELGSSLLGITGDPLAPASPTAPAAAGANPAAAAGGMDADPFADDLLAGSAPAATADAPSGSTAVDAFGSDDVLGVAAPAAVIQPAAGPVTGASTDLPAAASPTLDDTLAEPVAYEPEPAPTYEPTTDFSQSVASAEQAEVALDADVDTLFDDLG